MVRDGRARRGRGLPARRGRPASRRRSRSATEGFDGELRSLPPRAGSCSTPGSMAAVQWGVCGSSWPFQRRLPDRPCSTRPTRRPLIGREVSATMCGSWPGQPAIPEADYRELVASSWLSRATTRPGSRRSRSAGNDIGPGGRRFRGDGSAREPGRAAPGEMDGNRATLQAQEDHLHDGRAETVQRPADRGPP